MEGVPTVNINHDTINSTIGIRNVLQQQQQQQKYAKYEEKIEEILKRLCYNLFITLYSETVSDIDVQEYYESFTNDTTLTNQLDDVLIKETHPFNKELLETCQIQIGLKSNNNNNDNNNNDNNNNDNHNDENNNDENDNDENDKNYENDDNNNEKIKMLSKIKTTQNIPMLFNASKIIKKIVKVLKEKDKIKKDGKHGKHGKHDDIKKLLEKILMEDEEEEEENKENGKSLKKVKYHREYYQEMVKRYLKEDDYYDYVLFSLFQKGHFCKDIMSLNQRKCMILSSRITLIEVCQLILTICEQRLKELNEKIDDDPKNRNDHERNDKYEKSCNIESKFQWQSLNTFFGIKIETNKEKERSLLMKDSAVDLFDNNNNNNNDNSNKQKVKNENENQQLAEEAINTNTNTIKSGYNYGITLLGKKIKELEGLLDPKDISKMNSILASRFSEQIQTNTEKEILKKEEEEEEKEKEEEEYEIIDDQEKVREKEKGIKSIDIDTILKIHPQWNRSTINGSQTKSFLDNTLALTYFIEILNNYEFNETTDTDKNRKRNNGTANENSSEINSNHSIQQLISQINVTYLCFCLASMMTITKALLDRSQFLKNNLATKEEVTFATHLLGIKDIKTFLNHSNSNDIPLFCQLMNEMNRQENLSEEEKESLGEEGHTTLYTLLGIRDKDFRLMVRLFLGMNEEYQRYSIVRYPKSDQPHLRQLYYDGEGIEKRPQKIYDFMRGLIMVFLLILIHYAFINQFQNSPFNLFSKR